MEDLEHHLLEQVAWSREFFWHRVRWKLVARHLPKKEPFGLLDIGAGAGFVGEYLAEEFPQADYFFIEPLSLLEKRLCELYGNDKNMVEKEDFSKIQFVSLLDVLEHQQDDQFYLRKLVRKMDTGSKLFLTVPAFSCLWSDWDQRLGHFRRYRKEDLIKIFKTLPVDVEEVKYIFAEMFPLALFRKWKGRFFKKGRGDFKDAEFPKLPFWINEFLFHMSCLFFRLNRFIPFGTTLFAAIRKKN